MAEAGGIEVQEIESDGFSLDLTNAHLPTIASVPLPATLTSLDLTANRLKNMEAPLLALSGMDCPPSAVLASSGDMHLHSGFAGNRQTAQAMWYEETDTLTAQIFGRFLCDRIYYRTPRRWDSWHQRRS